MNYVAVISPDRRDGSLEAGHALGFQYGMELGFDGEAVRHSFTLRCVPTDTMRQRVESLQVSVTPDIQLTRDADGFGNVLLEGTVPGPHGMFSVSVQGTVAVADCDGAPVPEAAEAGDDGMLFRYQTPRTTPGPALKGLTDSIRTDGGNLGIATDAMHLVHSSLIYEKGVTGPGTTAEEAMALGRGVCQDYSQVMISALRTLDVPCRYVVGFTVGEGESHAWVEVLDGGLWYGLDPTGDFPVGRDHIKVSHGRDYEDCRINRGVFFGARESYQRVLATVARIR